MEGKRRLERLVPNEMLIGVVAHASYTLQSKSSYQMNSLCASSKPVKLRERVQRYDTCAQALVESSKLDGPPGEDSAIAIRTLLW